MDMVEKLLTSVGIETVVPYVEEMWIWNMDDQLFYEVNGRIRYFVSLVVLMVIVVPCDHIVFSVVVDDTALRHGRSAGIPYKIGNTSIDVFTVFLFVCFRIVLLIFGIDVESIRMLFI